MDFFELLKIATVGPGRGSAARENKSVGASPEPKLHHLLTLAVIPSRCLGEGEMEAGPVLTACSLA